jgi:dihydrolipoamide dehydrogenase
MADNNSFDLIVIGGGPAGYVAAIRAAQLGKSVACIERDKLGGVCLNWGCIPTKALLAGAEFYEKVDKHASEWGIELDNVKHNWEKVIGRSRGVAGNLNKGVAGLFKKNKVKHFDGHAFIEAAGKVKVYDKEDVQRKGEVKHDLTGEKILIATGAQPRPMPGSPFDGDKIIAAKQAMTLAEQPEKLLIVGSGAIGMEFAYFYNAFGTKCTVVEMLDRLMPVEDHEVSEAIAKSFKKKGIETLTEHAVEKIEKTEKGIKATIKKVQAKTDEAHPAKKSYGAEGAERDKSKVKDGDGDTITIEADKVLVAIGVIGRYDGLFDDSLGIEEFKDHIKVDYRKENPTYETSVKGIYAVGDVIGPPWLAHVASEEAIVCVERMFGHDAPDVDYDSIPGCTYCQPQVASIGYTEQRLKEEGIEYNVGKFPFLASGKAQALGHTEGFVKMLTGKEHGEILGCHMIGEGVTEMIAEIGIARRLEATGEEVIATIHAHPTLSEAVHEAALGADGRMIHF